MNTTPLPLGEEAYHRDWDNLATTWLRERCEERGHEDGLATSGWCEECEVYEDSAEPMFTYAYPLQTHPERFDDYDQRMAQLLDNTALTLLRHHPTDSYYLGLCGGGMDMSQDIALAYHYVEKWIPFDVCTSVNTQPLLTTSKEQYALLKQAVNESLELYQGRAERKLQDFADAQKRWEERNGD